ncbi:MAG: PDDEXK nuclease domain-containing protein [Treponema sp.]|nr:PDDEXK nuclease domain-containing protein [Treponema sp.]
MPDKQISEIKGNDSITSGSKEYSILINSIGELLESARSQIANTVNNIMIQVYWQIGKYIVEFEQNGKERAEYGKKLLQTISQDLTVRYGKGFSHSNINSMRKLYLTFPILQTMSVKLTWSHYQEILKLDDSLEISFYIKECENEGWNVRELRRQMKSMLFHRLAMSKDKNQILMLAKKGQQIQTPEDILKDPYVLEFTGIENKDTYLEGDLENALVSHLQKFLLELGKGFAFVGRQYKMQIGSRIFKVDLVFYHHILKCFVLIDLKRGEIEHYDVGQMNMYLNYFKAEKNTDGDNPPIGIVLGAYKDQLLMEYATQGLENNLFVSKYQLYLPNREQLQKELEDLLEDDKD